ncbi:MAG: transcriptional repressor [Synechococcaceae cyanobacterium]|nr:transcriptional repressor [Synechococcaceae cyanobacterium]
MKAPSASCPPEPGPTAVLTARQRQLLELLREAGSELSSQALHRRLSDHRPLGLATVYRALRRLHQLGLVRTRQLATGETLYSPVDRDEHHLTCVDCGCSVRLPACPMHDHPLSEEMRQGFRLLFHTLEYYGLCAGCQEAGRPG